VNEIWRRILSKTSRKSFTDLKCAVESDENESQCLINRDPVEWPRFKGKQAQFPGWRHKPHGISSESFTNLN